MSANRLSDYRQKHTNIRRRAKVYSPLINLNNLESDGWAKNQLGERRLGELFFGRQTIGHLGDKLGRYGDSKLDGWATLFRRLGEMCERGENQN